MIELYKSWHGVAAYTIHHKGRFVMYVIVCKSEFNFNMILGYITVLKGVTVFKFVNELYYPSTTLDFISDLMRDAKVSLNP